MKTISGKDIPLTVESSSTIKSIKVEIQCKEGISVTEQRFLFSGCDLDDEKTLYDYNIQNGDTLYLVFHLTAFLITNNCLDPAYDYDFTNINDSGRQFSRAGERYLRPCGWNRIALKVTGKYDSDAWLGCCDGPGEWPVSYHGTIEKSAMGIADEGYKLSKGINFKFGKGIYSTPEVKIAEQFAQSFTYEGVHYKVVLQNRVNPVGLKRELHGDYLITSEDEGIRPYGVLIKRV